MSDFCDLDDLVRPAGQQKPKPAKGPGLKEKIKASTEKARLHSSAWILGLATQAGIAVALVLLANAAIARFEGDPLRTLYAQNPDIYGPDIVTLYDKRNAYCRPSWLHKLVAGFDRGTCMDKESALAEYSGRVLFAMQTDRASVRNLHSDSYDVLAGVTENAYAWRQERMRAKPVRAAELAEAATESAEDAPQ